jgi:hypothetical protein
MEVIIKLSIFPKAASHPRSKKDKMKNSKLVSFPNEAVSVNFKSENDLIDIVTKNAWSPFIFEKYRRLSDFISTDLIAFDIDEGMTIDEAEKVVERLNLSALCLPSPSHTEENHRFRLIFPLSKSIRDIDIFKETYAQLAENFPVDPQCKDACRFYFGSTIDDGFWIEGELYQPIIPKSELNNRTFDINKYKETALVLEDTKDIVNALYGQDKEKIPEQIDFFIRNAHTGLNGLWWTSSNSFLFTLGLQKIPFEKVSAVYESLAPEELDDNDLYLLENSYKDGYNKSEELENNKTKPRSRIRRKSRYEQKRFSN